MTDLVTDRLSSSWFSQVSPLFLEEVVLISFVVLVGILIIVAYLNYHTRVASGLPVEQLFETD